MAKLQQPAPKWEPDKFDRLDCEMVFEWPSFLQVALLFIVTAGDGVAHEPAWRSWFAAAEGLVPASVAGPGSTLQHVPSLSRCARMLVRGS